MAMRTPAMIISRGDLIKPWTVAHSSRAGSEKAVTRNDGASVPRR